MRSKGAGPLYPPYKYLRVFGLQHMSFSPLQAQPYLSPFSSPAVLGKALLENHELHHHHAIVLLLDSLPQPLPPPCWIKARETSPFRTCVERGGAVRSALGSSVI